MKKKLFSLFLLLTLLFVAGCNKEDKKSDADPTATSTPAPTATSTPTPVPENLAKAALEKLPASFETLLESSSANTVNYADGIGYDISMDLNVNEDLMSLLEIEGLSNISLDGSLDIKDSIAANLMLSLEETEVLTAALYANSESIMFNLPKYSTAYAAIAMEELLGTSLDDLMAETEALPSNEELFGFLQTALNGLVDCFKPQDGIETNVTIGVGDYVMTGDKHTVVASAADLEAYFKLLETEAAKIPGMTLDTEDFTTDSTANFVLNYYINEEGSFAVECYTDNTPKAPAVFVSTPNGICFYGVSGDVTEIYLYSTATSENAGTITIPNAIDGVEDFIINYETGDNAFAFSIEEDEMALTMRYSYVNETMNFEFTMTMDGISITMKETATDKKADIALSVGSFGMELASMNMVMTMRDYVEVAAPQNTTDVTTWAAGLDQDALTEDLLNLMYQFPFLMDLILGSEVGGSTGGSFEIDDPYSGNTGSYTIPEGYSDDFMGMTGYTVDSDGYVDFQPVEEEIFAIGKPSTGYDSIPITDDQKQALIDYTEKSFTQFDKHIDTFYWIFGSIEYDSVESHYTLNYEYSEPGNYNNIISLDFDAVSGEFIGVSIYNESKDKALRIANDLLDILNVDVTVTSELVEAYTTQNNFSFSGYDGAEYGSNYYHVEFSVYYPEW